MSDVNWIVQAADASETHGVSWDWFWDKVAPPVAAGIAIAFVGSLLLPRWNERFKGQRDHINQAVTDLRGQLTELQRTSADYWSKSGAYPADEAEIEYLIQDVASLFDASAVDGNTRQRQNLIAHLAAEIVTADFGTPGRLAEPDRARLVAVLASDVARIASADRRRYFHRSWVVRTLLRGWGWFSRKSKKVA